MADLSTVTKTEAIAKLNRLTGSLRSIREKAAESGERVARTAVVQGASFGAGYLIGRGWGQQVIPGTDLPVMAVGAGLAVAMGCAGFGGKACDTLVDGGNGVLTAYSANYGIMFGQKAKMEAAQKASAGK